MTTTYKKLGSVVATMTVGTSAIASSGLNTTLYTVPSLTSTVVSSIVVCNLGLNEHTFRIAIGNGTITLKDYIYYDLTIAGNDTFFCTAGITMATGNTIIVQANATDVVFSAFGSEIS